jgi:L-histidine N-alpha-methyltransferase
MTDLSYTIDVHLSPDEVQTRMKADAVAGLSRQPKSIPPVWFYDERGSQLFEEITALPEYYPTRAERALLVAHALDIAELSKSDTLVELGAGACTKTRLLLEALQQVGTLQRYIPFDVSDEFLRGAASSLSAEFDPLNVHLVIGDFHEHLGRIPVEGRRLIAFLGGTIGNLDPGQRSTFLGTLHDTMTGDDSLLLGTDLVKDRGPVHPCRPLERGRPVDRDAAAGPGGGRGEAGPCRSGGPLRRGRGPLDRDQRQVHSRAGARRTTGGRLRR